MAVKVEMVVIVAVRVAAADTKREKSGTARSRKVAAHPIPCSPLDSSSRRRMPCYCTFEG